MLVTSRGIVVLSVGANVDDVTVGPLLSQLVQQLSEAVLLRCWKS